VPLRKATLKPVVIWGARGHALVLVDLLVSAGLRPIAFFDNDPRSKSPVGGVPIYHGDRGYASWTRQKKGRRRIACAVAIGGGRGDDRLRILRRLAADGLHPATLVHPAAVVASSAEIGLGCQILAGAIVGPASTLGMAVIVNTAASVDHECNLAEGVHVGPGAVLAGCVRVGARAFIGAGAVVLPRISIGSDAIVGAGAIVRAHVRARSVVAGNPARPLRRRRDGTGGE